VQLRLNDKATAKSERDGDSAQAELFETDQTLQLAAVKSAELRALEPDPAAGRQTRGFNEQ